MRMTLVAGMIIALFASGMAIVLSRNEAQNRFVELQQLYKERDELQEEWGRLLLEQATWATHGRIEEIARTKLGMHMVNSNEVVYIPYEGI